MKRRVVFAVVMTLSCAPLTRAGGPCDLVPKGLLPTLHRELRGSYQNVTYAFSVLIPNGLVGYDAPDPHPHHGFGLVLGTNRPRYIMVEAAANTLEHASATEAVKHLLAAERADRLLVSSPSQRAARLRGLDAVHVVARFQCRDSGAEYILHGIVALSPDRETMYQVDLYMWPETAAKDELLWNDLVRSWKYERR